MRDQAVPAFHECHEKLRDWVVDMSDEFSQEKVIQMTWLLLPHLNPINRSGNQSAAQFLRGKRIRLGICREDCASHNADRKSQIAPKSMPLRKIYKGIQWSLGGMIVTLPTAFTSVFWLWFVAQTSGCQLSQTDRSATSEQL
jgi:hypothetical protein